MSDHDHHAIGTLTQVTNLADDIWDLARTGRSRLTDPSAQRDGKTGGPAAIICIATRLLDLRQHPTQPTRYAVRISKSGDANARGLMQWFEDPAHPGRKTALLAGPTITLTFPDGTTATRVNHFFVNDAATTLARYNRLRRIVLPDAWSNTTPYAVGDTVWRPIGAQNVPIGFRCLVANTGSAPTMSNANWSAYLGPLPADWEPVGP